IPRSKWQRSAFAFAIAALFTFMINLSFMIWATLSQGVYAKDGIGILLEAETCSAAHILNIGIHVVINTVSSVLLAGSNYCMQCLIAPTRPEIDIAHAQHHWVDVGIPSVRNFQRIPWKRKVSWLLLSATSLSLHLLYNSVIFTSTSVNEHLVFLVNNDFLTTNYTHSLPPGRRNHNLDAMHNAFNNGLLQLIQSDECLRMYAEGFQSSRGNLALIATNNTGETAPIKYTRAQFSANEQGISPPSDWICEQQPGFVNRTCKPDDMLPLLLRDSSLWKPFNAKIQGCYSQSTSEHCNVLFSYAFGLVITAITFIQGILMLCVAFSKNEKPILTIGDVITSFLKAEDSTTKHMCLKSQNDFSKTGWTQEPHPFRKAHTLKCHAINRNRWIACGIVYV
ncbi:hypothetical protein K456DRAFT_1837294, partial [Colletotrichum gloeosporioides 23]